MKPALDLLRRFRRRVREAHQADCDLTCAPASDLPAEAWNEVVLASARVDEALRRLTTAINLSAAPRRRPVRKLTPTPPGPGDC